jgi:hypothetical protein
MVGYFDDIIMPSIIIYYNHSNLLTINDHNDALQLRPHIGICSTSASERNTRAELVEGAEQPVIPYGWPYPEEFTNLWGKALISYQSLIPMFPSYQMVHGYIQKLFLPAGDFTNHSPFTSFHGRSPKHPTPAAAANRAGPKCPW